MCKTCNSIDLFASTLEWTKGVRIRSIFIFSLIQFAILTFSYKFCFEHLGSSWNQLRFREFMFRSTRTITGQKTASFNYSVNRAFTCYDLLYWVKVESERSDIASRTEKQTFSLWLLFDHYLIFCISAVYRSD